jgi:hypothetical protein
MIELKKEYTILLCNVLTPIILEGLQHLYNEYKKNSTKNKILKTFQLLLKSIPSLLSHVLLLLHLNDSFSVDSNRLESFSYTNLILLQWTNRKNKIMSMHSL